MILSAHQPAYLPWLGYFHKVMLSDIFVILNDVQFEKNSFTNRNKIKTHQGETFLTVPIFMKGHMAKTIQEMEINNLIDWRDKHWKTIYLNYKKAPYFSKYEAFFENVYRNEWLKLIDLINYTNTYLFNELGVNTKLVNQNDLQIKSKKQDLVLDLCKKTGATLYISGKLGKDYIDSSIFTKNNIQIYFQNYQHPSYTQLYDCFIPNLSIIDSLFNIGPENTKDIIFSGNILKDQLKGILNNE